MQAFCKRVLGKIRHQSWRTVYRIRGKEFIHFIHIGKTGGTAVKCAIRTNPVTEKYAIVLHHHERRLRSIPSGEGVFFIVRDPIARFVSAFCFRQRQGLPGHWSPWDENEAKIFAKFHEPNQLALALSSKDPVYRREAVHAMNSIGHLNRSYWYWFGTRSYFFSRLPDIVFIGFQESLSADFEQLKTKLGLPIDLKLPTDPVTANRAPATGNRELNEAATRNLKEWYAQDYDFFALCEGIRNSMTVSSGARAQ